MQQRVFRLPLSLTMAALGWLVVGSIAATAAPSPQPFDDDSFQPSSVTFGGADPLETTRTVEHWAGASFRRTSSAIASSASRRRPRPVTVGTARPGPQRAAQARQG